RGPQLNLFPVLAGLTGLTLGPLRPYQLTECDEVLPRAAPEAPLDVRGRHLQADLLPVRSCRPLRALGSLWAPWPFEVAQRDEVLPGAVSRVPPLYVRLAGLEFDFAAIRPGGTLFTFRSQGPSWTLGTHLTSLTLGAFGPLRSLGSLWAGDVGEGHQVMPSGLGDLAP